jgi:Cu/Ag efflux pump CusA
LDRRVERESRRIVVALAALVRVVGYARFQDVPRDVLPEFTPPTVEVQTEALGLSAVEEGHPFGVRAGQTGGG